MFYSGMDGLSFAAVLRTGVAGSSFKNKSPILTAIKPVECFLDQKRPSRGASGVRFVVRVKPIETPLSKTQKRRKNRGAPSRDDFRSLLNARSAEPI